MENYVQGIINDVAQKQDLFAKQANPLNEITGDELEEDLVNKIFGDFCVGK